MDVVVPFVAPDSIFLDFIWLAAPWFAECFEVALSFIHGTHICHVGLTTNKTDTVWSTLNTSWHWEHFNSRRSDGLQRCPWVDCQRGVDFKSWGRTLIIISSWSIKAVSIIIVPFSVLAAISIIATIYIKCVSSSSPFIVLSKYELVS